MWLVVTANMERIEAVKAENSRSWECKEVLLRVERDSLRQRACFGKENCCVAKVLSLCWCGSNSQEYFLLNRIVIWVKNVQID